MSYILDALRKSEKERRRGEVPGVLSQQDAPYPVRRRRILWPYLVLGALAVNAGVLLWVFNPWQQKAPALPPAQTATAPDPPQAETARVEEKPDQRSRDSKRSAPDVPAGKAQAGEGLKGKVAPEAPAKKKAEGIARPGDDAAGGLLQQTQPVQREEAAAKTGEDVPPPVPNKTYAMAELPASLKQKLPALSLSLTVYSDDRASRLATVNGQTVREGQTLPEGVKVEEILPDSVVFAFQGYRFSVHMR